MSDQTNEVKTLLTMDDLAGRLGNPNTYITHDGRRLMLVPPGYQVSAQQLVRQNCISARGYNDFLSAVKLQQAGRQAQRQAATIFSVEHPYVEVDMKALKVIYWPDTSPNEASAVLSLSLSTEIQRWIGGFTQDSLVDQIETWGNDLALNEEQRLALVMAIKNMELTSAVKFTAARSHGNVEIGFTSKDGGETFAALPETWKLIVPVLEGMENWPIELRLAINVPRQEGQVPVFKFTCPKLDFYKEQAALAIFNKLCNDMSCPVIRV